MAIIEDDDPSGSGSIVNFQKIKTYLSFYKFPLVLSAIGFVFLTIAAALMIRTRLTSSEVIFSSADASPAAKITDAKIQVDVEGAVMRPGVYTLAENDRITRALSAAGGLSADADREWVAKNLNLAAKLVDGGKIYIPSVAAATSGQSQNSNAQTQIIGNLSISTNLLGVTAGKININTAGEAELDSLPGIGKVTADKIISARPYQSVDDLIKKKILGQAAFVKIKDLIVVY